MLLCFVSVIVKSLPSIVNTIDEFSIYAALLLLYSLFLQDKNVTPDLTAFPLTVLRLGPFHYGLV